MTHRELCLIEMVTFDLEMSLPVSYFKRMTQQGTLPSFVRSSFKAEIGRFKEIILLEII